MAVTPGVPERLELTSVAISPNLAIGFQKENWRFEVDRIAGTASLFPADPDSQRRGITGAYYRGNCAPVR